jgi:hypothetical protein
MSACQPVAMLVFGTEEHADLRYRAPFLNRRIRDMPLFYKVHMLLRATRTFAKHTAGRETE